MVPMLPDLMSASSMWRERRQFHCPRRHGDELVGGRALRRSRRAAAADNLLAPPPPIFGIGAPPTFH